MRYESPNLHQRLGCVFINGLSQTHGVNSVVDLNSPSAILEIGSEDDMNTKVCVGAETFHDALSIGSGARGLRIGF